MRFNNSTACRHALQGVEQQIYFELLKQEGRVGGGLIQGKG